jgi:hypothetical protein
MLEGEQLSVPHNKLKSPAVEILEGQMLKTCLETCLSSMKGCSSSNIRVLAYSDHQFL